MAKLDDRAIAIVLAAEVEDALKDAITTKFVELTPDDDAALFEGDAPLSSLSSKIRMAYALGVIGKDARYDLEIIRRVRNVFAHVRWDIDFSTQEVEIACDSFRFIGKESSARYANEQEIEWPPPSARDKFRETATYLYFAFSCVRSPGLEELLGMDLPPLT